MNTIMTWLAAHQMFLTAFAYPVLLKVFEVLFNMMGATKLGKLCAELGINAQGVMNVVQQLLSPPPPPPAVPPAAPPAP